MSGLCGFDCRGDAFGIADFANEENLAIGTEVGSDEGGVVAFRVNRSLGGEKWETVFDRVFDRCKRAVRIVLVEGLHGGVERGAFAGACGSADDDEAILHVESFFPEFGSLFWEVEVSDSVFESGAIEEAHDNFGEGSACGDGFDSKIDSFVGFRINPCSASWLWAFDFVAHQLGVFEGVAVKFL